MSEADSEQVFRLHMTAFLHKLQRAGWINHFDEPDSDRPITIEWNHQKEPDGGRKNLLALAHMLRELSATSPLSDEEQIMLQLLCRDEFDS